MSVSPGDTTPAASGPDDLTITEAVEMYLDKRSTDATDSTIRFYRNRLRQFVEWCHTQDLTHVRELDGWAIQQFEAKRRQDGLAATSLKSQMTAVRLLVKYCEHLEALPEGFHEKISVPAVSRDQESSDERLDPSHATRLLNHYRDTPELYGTVEHAALEIMWHTGCRIGGLRALDLDDCNLTERYLDFRNRPDTGTRLKNGSHGERAVALNPAVCDVLQFYIDRERWDKHDEYGRQPLFCTRQGRASESSIRAWSYLATHPCIYRRCPHGNQIETCQYRERNHASQCPSARSPHAVRTGSITWQLNKGLPAEVVADRVNASLSVIERHYDKAGRVEKLEERRREHTDALDIDTTEQDGDHR